MKDYGVALALQRMTYRKISKIGPDLIQSQKPNL